MAKPKNRLFIVDDDATNAEMLRQFVEEKFDLNVLSFTSGDDALRNLNADPTFVLVDYYLDRNGTGGTTGMDVLKRVKQSHPGAFVVLLSTQDKIDVAADAMKYGAFDYVVKNPAGFLRVENVLNRINILLRDRATIKTYRTLAFVSMGLVLLLGLILYMILQGNAGAQ
jgi:DNA-binding NtrC family response regulator